MARAGVNVETSAMEDTPTTMLSEKKLLKMTAVVQDFGSVLDARTAAEPESFID